MYKQAIAVILALFVSVSFSAAVMADTQTLGMTKLASANPCGKKEHNPCGMKMDNPCGKKNHDMKEGNPCGKKW